MRILLAALVVFAGVLGAVLVLGEWIERASPIGLLAAACGLASLFALLGLGVLAFFDEKGVAGQTIQEMEEQGLLVSEYYRATRAFEVQEFQDEGPHYFIELENGSVLYLNGRTFTTMRKSKMTRR